MYAANIGPQQTQIGICQPRPLLTLRVLQWKIPRSQETQLPQVLERLEGKKAELGLADVQVRVAWGMDHPVGYCSSSNPE
jgi:hypothetical protein